MGSMNAMPMRGNADMAPAGMVGSSNPAQPAPGSVTTEEVSRAIMQQIRTLSNSVDTIARQFPVAAQEARIVQDTLIKMMTKIVSSRQTGEPEAPNTMG